ncbi:hypothetical protein OAA15_00680 [bacterium]|nr:hypothetical protein [bacterium]
MTNTKRKAIKCELARTSNSHPNYFKYIVTIEELDGTTHQVPSYGKDMQDAISRLVWTERGERVVNTIDNTLTTETSTNLMVLMAMVSIAIPAIISYNLNEPSIILSTLACYTLLGSTYVFIKNKK